MVYICTSIINLFQKKILHFCSSGLTLIFKTAGRKTVSLVVVEPVHALAIVAEEPVPRVSSIVLRRRPEEGVVREIAETAPADPEAARMGSGYTLPA